MIQDDLAEVLRDALARAGVDPPDVIHLERPARREHGDWSSNVALATAKMAGRNPRKLATEIAKVLNDDLPSHVASVEVAGPGFVNFRLHDSWLHDVLGVVVEAGEDNYGRTDISNGERVQVEFVSANPTGPLHVGNGWLCSYGDALARLLARCGWAVEREYYVNDTGGQIRRLGESLLARSQGEAVSEEGYQGAYVRELATEYDGPQDVVAAGSWAAERILENIRTTLERIGIEFDEWFSQASIEESGAVEEVIALLRDRGLIYDE